ncbi:hypothetical protein DFH06DRAFT_379692 [Mycena polygramma]|nr:hypothetical protein DFH06DRAFT_379692 [Mycena polygramma]
MLAHLEADRLRAADLDAQIMDLKRCLAALKTEKVSVRERLDSYRYPVLTLPNELISEIFIRFLPVYPRCPPLIGLLSPTLLTQICRQWRELSLGTPALWRALPLPNTRLKNQPVHLWLSRSSPCPLAVAFDCRHAKTSEALVAAVSHRIRWEHIEFCLSPSDIRIIDVSMPLLHHLNLQVAAPCMSVIKFTLSELPLLRIVTLNNYALDSIVLPWAQLTSLTLCEVTPSRLYPSFTANSKPHALQIGYVLPRLW